MAHLPACPARSAPLSLVQEQQGYLTANALRHVAQFLRITPAEVEDVATYYVMFFRAPVGKYVLQVCRTLSCALMGAERVTDAVTRMRVVANKGAIIFKDGSTAAEIIMQTAQSLQDVGPSLKTPARASVKKSLL